MSAEPVVSRPRGVLLRLGFTSERVGVRVPKPALADIMDYVGRNERRRKERVINRDTREPGGRVGPPTVTEVILTGKGFTLDRHALVVGDYSWELRSEAALYKLGYREVVVERKTLADIRDTDRLQSQLNRAYKLMDNNYTLINPMFFIVLIDYTEDTDMGRMWSDDQLLNAELSITLGSHFKVTRCASGLLAQRLESIYLWTQKPSHSLG